MKLAVMAKSKYFSPKIKLQDFPIFILVIFLFLIAGPTCGRWHGKIYPFLMEKKNPFSFGTVSVTSKLLLEHVSGLVEKLMEGRVIV